MRAAGFPWLYLLIWLGVAAGSATAQQSDTPEVFEPQPHADNWTQQKCELFQHIFSDALTLQGHDGLSNEFLNTNQRFIDSGCQGERTLCPISEEELKFANLLTVMTMNEGMASTFVPFGCED